MSQENLEIVRLAYSRLSGGDIDGALQLCAADIEFRDLPELPGSGVFVGHDGFRAWYAGVVDSIEDLRFDGEEFIDAGDRVVVVTHATGRGKGSGAVVELHVSSVWTLSDGKLTKQITFSDHADALAAAGLRE